MTQLYLANSTRQTILFQVRWPGDHSGKVWERPLPTGSRLVLTDRDVGIDPGMKWAVIREHLDRMGAVEASEIDRADLNGFKGLSYSFGKEISIEKVEQAHEVVLDNAAHVSADEMLKAAAGAHIAINGQDSRVKTSSVEVIEDFDRRTGPRKDNVNFRVEVTADNAAPPPAKRGRPKRS